MVVGGDEEEEDAEGWDADARESLYVTTSAGKRWNLFSAFNGCFFLFHRSTVTFCTEVFLGREKSRAVTVWVGPYFLTGYRWISVAEKYIYTIDDDIRKT